MKESSGNTPELYRTLQGHNDAIQCIAFNSNSRQLASVSGDHALYLWNLQAKNIQSKKLKGHNGAITEVGTSNAGGVQSLWRPHRHCLHGQHCESLEQQRHRQLPQPGHPVSQRLRQERRLQS